MECKHSLWMSLDNYMEIKRNPQNREPLKVIELIWTIARTGQSKKLRIKQLMSPSHYSHSNHSVNPTIISITLQVMHFSFYFNLKLAIIMCKALS